MMKIIPLVVLMLLSACSSQEKNFIDESNFSEASITVLEFSQTVAGSGGGKAEDLLQLQKQKILKSQDLN